MPPPAAPSLPQERGLDIAAFSRTLNDTATAYKFLWLLALLDCLPPAEKVPKPIAMQKITLRMLRLADAPIRRYRLSFGVADRTERFIASFDFLKEEAGDRPLEWSDEKLLERAPRECAEINRGLSLFVPKQWLVPFFEGKEKLPPKSGARASKIFELASQYFVKKPPLPYRFIGAGREVSLEFHPRWISYFVRNQEIIRGWAMYRWIDYLQARNPNTPAIVAKIAHPQQRIQLGNEREWWGRVLGIIGGARCIYSGAKIVGGEFELDHFLPWSFVGHNRLWNLIPVSPAANSSKGDNLPHLDKYLPPFVKMQQRALKAYSENLRRFSRQREIADAYISDLRIPVSPPPTLNKLSQAYRDDIVPLANLARNRGFSPNWKYHQ